MSRPQMCEMCALVAENDRLRDLLVDCEPWLKRWLRLIEKSTIVRDTVDVPKLEDALARVQAATTVPR